MFNVLLSVASLVCCCGIAYELHHEPSPLILWGASFLVVIGGVIGLLRSIRQLIDPSSR